MKNNNSHIRVSAKDVFKRFVPMLLVGLSLYVIVLVMMFFVHRNGQLELLQSEQRSEMGKVNEDVHAELESIVGDLLILHSHYELYSYLSNRDQTSYHHIVHEFEAFMGLGRKYDMVRIFDTLGLEILRVESNDGEISASDQSELSDKSSRYYFQDGMRLSADEIFISELDLNVENGEVEFPIHPTLRFIKSVTDKNGLRIGLLAVNYDASNLINLISERSSLNHGHPLIVNGDGYWILSDNHDQEWGHVLEERGDHLFSEMYLDEWKLLNSEKKAQIQSTNGIFTSFTVNLADSSVSYFEKNYLTHFEDRIDGGASESSPKNPSYGHYLHFISHIPREEVVSATDHIGSGAIYVISLLSVLLGALLWFNARMRVIHQLGETLLAVSEIKHRTMFDASLDPMINADHRGIILAASASTEKVFGWKPEELVGKSIMTLVPESRVEESSKIFARLLDVGTKIGNGGILEAERMKKDGTVFPCEITVTRVLIPGESNIQLFAIIRDITERKATEAKLRESEDIYRCLFTDAPYAYLNTDKDGIITRINSKVTDIYGFSEAEMIGKKYSDFFGGDLEKLNLHQSLEPQLSQTGRVRSSGEIEFGVTRADGESVLVSASANLIYDEEGNLLTKMLSSTDITARRAAEAELRLKDAALLEERKSKQEYLHGIIDSAPNLIYARDSEGKFTLINSAFEKFVGVNRNELLGRSLEELSLSEDGAFAITMCDMAVFTTETDLFEPEEKYSDSEGKERWLLTSKKLLKRGVDNASELLSVSTDLTELSAAKTAAISADKMAAIGTLASGITHEFRNYLAAVIGNAEYMKQLLSDREDDSELHELVGGIIEAGDRANEVTTALLGYSKKRPDQVGVENIVELVESTLLLVSRRAAQRKIRVEVDFGNVPLALVSAGKIQQLILNLLTNAIDAAPSEGGLLRVSIGEEGKYLALRVSDNGAGIPDRQLRKVFDPFFSTKGVWGDDSPSGAGLGLAICRNIAEEHEGTLSVESFEGEGTTFTLRIPFVESETPSGSDGWTSEFDTYVLFSHDDDMVQRLSQQIAELDSACIVLDSFDGLDDNCEFVRTLLICDGAFPSASELYHVCSAYRSAGAKVALLARGAAGSLMDEQSVDFVCNNNSSLQNLLLSLRPTTHSVKSSQE